MSKSLNLVGGFVAGVALLAVASLRTVEANCSSNGQSPNAVAMTCVAPGYGSIDTMALSNTNPGLTEPESASTEVWVDGGTGPASGIWGATKYEEPMCGTVRAFSNNWLIFNGGWSNVAYWLSVEDSVYDCE